MSEITWYGHSAFKISGGGASVVIDPFFAPSSGCLDSTERSNAKEPRR